MRTLRATTLAGTDIQLDSAVVTAFKARLHGALVCPEDPPYEQARKVWNGMIDKHPALIARCTGVADVLHTGFCRNVAFLKPNGKVGCQKVKNLRASTVLFSVICDSILAGEGPGISRRRAQ